MHSSLWHISLYSSFRKTDICKVKVATSAITATTSNPTTMISLVSLLVFFTSLELLYGLESDLINLSILVLNDGVKLDWKTYHDDSDGLLVSSGFLSLPSGSLTYRKRFSYIKFSYLNSKFIKHIGTFRYSLIKIWRWCLRCSP